MRDSSQIAQQSGLGLFAICPEQNPGSGAGFTLPPTLAALPVHGWHLCSQVTLTHTLKCPLLKLGHSMWAVTVLTQESYSKAWLVSPPSASWALSYLAHCYHVAAMSTE